MEDEPLTKPPKKRFNWRIFWLVAVAISAGLLGYLYSVKQRVVVAHEGDSAAVLSAKSLEDLAASGLRRDGDARVNIILFGKGGAEHEGGNLTDTIQVASIDVFNNQISMLSIPRDLYVDTDWGSMKINAVYSAAETRKKGSGGQAMKSLLSNITDLTTHYFVLVDFDGFVKLVDALGSITVDVKNPINDYEYPKDDGSYTVEKFTMTTGTHKMDGQTALKFVRSRHSLGAEGSDFARSARQQQVVAAVRDRAKQIGILANPLKMLQIIDLVGSHLKTDMNSTEMKALLEKMNNVNDTSIKTAVLSNSPEGLLTDKVSVGAYTLLPRAGRKDYSEIQLLLHSLAPDPLVRKEAAKVRIVYPEKSSKGKENAQAWENLLKNYGYNVVGVSATSENPDKNTLVSYRGQKYPYTTNYLAQRIKNTTASRKAVDDNVDFDLIVVKNVQGK